MAELLPGEPEAWGLLALLELQASRLPARQADGGASVLLEEQDRTRWDRARVAAGLAHLERATGEGAYVLQAGIASCHARAERFEDTDWREIVRLYDALVARTHSPVIALNRALAVSRVDGPEAALALVDGLASDARLARYAWLPAARADLLRRAGRVAEAVAEYRRAVAATGNRAERAALERRLAECEARAAPVAR